MSTLTPEDFEPLRGKIVEYTQQGKGSIFVRLAFHDAGTFHKDLGKGGGATVRYLLGIAQNAGLEFIIHALEDARGELNLNPAISNADIYQFAAVVAIETMGGPRIPFRPGRVDLSEQDAQEILNFHVDHGIDILPKPNNQERLRTVFGKYNFGDKDIVVLSGAHTVGSALVPEDIDPRLPGQQHLVDVVMENPRKTWSLDNQHFDNDYFVQVYKNQWSANIIFLKGEKGKKVWFDTNTAKMMLFETDFVLITNQAFKKIGKLYRDDNELFKNDFAVTFQRLSELGHESTLGENINGPREV